MPRVLKFLLTENFPKRPILALFWAFTIGIAVLVASKHLVHRKDEGDGKVVNYKRKYFHALATMLFIPGFYMDPDFLSLAFSVSLAGMIFVEYLRYFHVWPLGGILEDFLTSFLDERESGPAILSHIYLLIGCAVPVWFSRIASPMPVAGLVGVLTLGIGDSAVCAV
ncbi:hypothetical protein HDV00_005772 [Rhizophlyctis rosea]|nr:hypothetical protein HDV00_005772 [Rhizophlyctis rosea]